MGGAAAVPVRGKLQITDPQKLIDTYKALLEAACEQFWLVEDIIMARIVILNGSPRKNGKTASLIKAFADGAESAGNEVREGQADGKDPAIKGENYVDLSQLQAILPE